MDFDLNDEQQMIREMVRDFAQNEIAPIAAEIDRTETFPWEIIRKMASLGLLGIPFPEEYGGAGGDTISYAIAVEEISRASGSVGITLAAHTSLGSTPFYLFGTEAQKKKYLVPLARGEGLGAFGLTEPDAGSDAGATKTTAVRLGDHWVLNGQKIYITSGAIARTLIATATTDKSLGSRGISCFIVEQGTPGFIAGRNESKLGLRASLTSQLFFEDCKVPAENILGKAGEGFKQMLITLDGGRISIGAMAVGIAQAALDAALQYAQERVQFNQPIAKFQAIQFKLADMAMEVEHARLSVYRAAWLKDQHRPFTKEAAMAKLYASEVADRVCNQAIQIHGGIGYTTDVPVERYWRDARLCEIGEGTSEIQRLVIARQILRGL